MHLAEQPLTKVTLNLFAADVIELKRLEGSGYQIKVRDIVHQYLQRKKIEHLKREGHNAKL